MKKKNPERIML